MDDQLTLDTWSALDFKTPALPTNSDLIATWVGDARRRLNAYILLDSYDRNVSRFFMNGDLDITVEELHDLRDDRRELGDSRVIVDTTLAALLGNDVTVTCDGNEALEKFAQKWAKKARAIRKLFNAEDHAILKGDGVIALFTDTVKKRIDMKVYDPGFYFPVLDGADDLEFPTRVHIAWEFERLRPNPTSSIDTTIWIRRKTWDLRDGKCYYSDGEWLRDDLPLGVDYDTLPKQLAHWYKNAKGEELHDIDTKLDFIPVVHIPNTSVDDDEHFGQSSLATILQIIDEIQATDSDLAKSASIAGFPPLASEGSLATADGQTVDSYGPGTVFGGKLSSLDTSKALDALLKYLDQLLQRLSVNSHLPESAIGRIKPSEVPSGLAFALGFAPLQAMIYKMRLVREEKYPLITKFMIRMHQAAGFPGLPKFDEEADDFNWPTFTPGSFLPSDIDTTINAVSKMLQTRPRSISLETAIQMLINAGLPIEDAAEEVKRIVKNDFDGAEKLQKATGDPREAFKYLGLEVPADYETPGQIADRQAAAKQAALADQPGPDAGNPPPPRPDQPPVVS